MLVQQCRLARFFVQLQFPFRLNLGHFERRQRHDSLVLLQSIPSSLVLLQSSSESLLEAAPLSTFRLSSPHSAPFSPPSAPFSPRSPRSPRFTPLCPAWLLSFLFTVFRSKSGQPGLVSTRTFISLLDIGFAVRLSECYRFYALSASGVLHCRIGSAEQYNSIVREQIDFSKPSTCSLLQ